MKTFKQHLEEGHYRGDYYHTTMVQNFAQIIDDEKMWATPNSYIDRKHFGDIAFRKRGVSLSRTLRNDFLKNFKNHSVGITLKLDGDKMRQRFKIVPVVDQGVIFGRGKGEEGWDEAEERIIVDTHVNLSKMPIKKIYAFLAANAPLSPEERRALGKISLWAKENNIPLEWMK